MSQKERKGKVWRSTTLFDEQNNKTDQEIQDTVFEANPYVNSAGWRLGAGRSKKDYRASSSLSNSHLDYHEPEPEESRNHDMSNDT